LSYFDLKKDSLPSEVNCDVCIVGSGAAGVATSLRLINHDIKILIMESGELKPNQSTQKLYDFNNIGYPIRKDFMSRVRYHGGTTNIWSGRTMILKRIDFMERDWVTDSGWPFAYSRIMFYYKEAVKLLKLPRLSWYNSGNWVNKMNKHEKSITEDANIRVNASLWGTKTINFRKEYFSVLKSSRNLNVYLNSNLIKITLNENKKYVSRLDFISLNGNMLSVKPKICVLACGGLENARLLLNSRHQQEFGLGNENDCVGRYYSDHPRSVMGRVVLKKEVRLPLFLGCPFSEGKIQLGIQFSEDYQRSNQLLNNYISLEQVVPDYLMESYNTIIRLGKRFLKKGYSGKRLNFSTSIASIPEIIYYFTPKELLPHKLYTLVYPYINYSKRNNILKVANYCEQAPNPRSRVILSKEKCKLGLHKIILDWKLGQNERESVIKLHELLESYLMKNKIGKFYKDYNDLEFTDASHHIGTTRMSHSPKNGVVDSNCKVHNLDNLYITGSSVFPTSGHANPTLTIVALSLRLGDHIGKKFIE
jgi:choline dehydrogenase-like flavoprotein|tara:strand:+ start:419 stop:2020 length:1602 start_codon:yes stop_codon:yes gene_type:complete